MFKHTTVSLNNIKALNPSHIVISPGPNSPNETPGSMMVIDAFHQTKPLLGVCLGHQCIAHYFGGNIIIANEIFHGKTSYIYHSNTPLFHRIPRPFKATRYHSLIIDEKTLPNVLSIDAKTKSDLIMAISHRNLPIFGVQFHPEAILSEYGLTLFENYLAI